jgi:hypothetical protein
MFLIATALAFAGPSSAGEGRASDVAALQRYIRSLPPAADPGDDAYQVGWVDLNRDGRLDAVVRWTGQPYCGSGGCNLTILERTRSGFRPRGSATITRLPIKVLRTSHSGWRDLSTWMEGGGIRPGCTALMDFSGARYRRHNCWPPEEPGIKADGRVIIARSQATP